MVKKLLCGFYDFTCLFNLRVVKFEFCLYMRNHTLKSYLIIVILLFTPSFFLSLSLLFFLSCSTLLARNSATSIMAIEYELSTIGKQYTPAHRIYYGNKKKELLHTHKKTKGTHIQKMNE